MQDNELVACSCDRWEAPQMAARRSTTLAPTNLVVRLDPASPALSRVIRLQGGAPVKVRLAA
jgi:hypothetical protein